MLPFYLTIFFQISQATLRAIINAVDNAHVCYDNNPSSWRRVIEAASNLLTRADVRRFERVCEMGHNEVGQNEYQLVEVYNESFATTPTYYVIRRGVLSVSDEHRDDGMYEDNPYMPYEGVERYVSGRDFFLAYHQWHGYMEWLRQRPRDMQRYREFEVRF
jgi:hypothetical protein